MTDYVIWFVLGFALLVAELLTGTFYLLVIAVAFGAAGLAALLGASIAVQLVVATVIGVAGSIWLRQTRFGKLSRKDAADSMQHMDVGQSVHVEQWNTNRTARANYRGAQWDVELAHDETAAPGEFVIREIHANRLIVAARK